MSDSSVASIAHARSIGADALRAAGHRAALSALRHGGALVARLGRRPRGGSVLQRAIVLALPRWFDAGAAGGLEACFELRIRGAAAGSPQAYAVQISDRRCAVSPGRAVDPGAVVTIAAEDVIRAASGVLGWPELMSSGRLVLSGDPFLALRFPSLFRLPASAS